MNKSTKAVATVAPAFDEAEHEIRRMVSRHHSLTCEISALQTELQAWQLEAKSAQAEIERLTKALDKAEADRDRYMAGLATLQGQYRAGAKMFIEAVNTLNELGLPQLHTVPEEANG